MIISRINVFKSISKWSIFETFIMISKVKYNSYLGSNICNAYRKILIDHDCKLAFKYRLFELKI